MNKNEFLQEYASHLSDQQIAGVTAEEDAVLLLAVPGSGKTTVLVTRIGYLLKVRGIRPENVLTLTYTVAATKDMQRRYEEVFGAEVSAGLEFRTINGICAKIIQKYADAVGKPAFSLVTEDGDVARILTDVLARNLSEYPTESDVKAARTLITYCKNMMLTAEEIERVGERENFPLASVYMEYKEYLKEHSLMDYDDQMRYAYVMLSKTPEMLAFWQNRYRHVLVDEAQDTSKIQHEIIKLLTAHGGNLFMVGDEDQSIYGFRAAYPEALLDFEKDHPGARVLVMDRNFRSNAEIVTMADTFIRRNKARHDKRMVASREAASRVNFVQVQTRQAQYARLVKEADGCTRQTAVLYRDNESALPLIDLLERKGIPYRVRNGDFTFFTSRVVTDVTNVLRLALDPYNTELFMKVYFKMQAYLRKNQAVELCRISELNHVTVWQAAEEARGINGKTIGRCRAMATNLRAMLSEVPSKALFRIETPMGYREYMDRNGLDRGKLFLLRVIAEREQTIAGFLGRLEALQELLCEKEYDPKCMFILSTIHSSKGLEYDRVILMDVMDGVFPAAQVASASARTPEVKLLEEERRLFYVGMTRTVNELTIIKCEREKSRFLTELKSATPVSRNKNSVRRPVPVEKPSMEHLLPRKEVAPPDLVVNVGDRIQHKKYGAGTVVGVKNDERGSASRIRVLLDGGEEKLFTHMAFQNAMKVVPQKD